jgi:predicted DNA-binding transcriptional regulator AlpA
MRKRSKKSNFAMPKAVSEQLPVIGTETLSRAQVARKLGVCVATIKRMEDRGMFSPIRLSRQTVRYRLSDIDAYLENAAQTRRVAP